MNHKMKATAEGLPHREINASYHYSSEGVVTVRGYSWGTCKINLEVGQALMHEWAALMAFMTDVKESVLGKLLTWVSCTHGITRLARYS